MSWKLTRMVRPLTAPIDSTRPSSRPWLGPKCAPLGLSRRPPAMAVRRSLRAWRARRPSSCDSCSGAPAPRAAGCDSGTPVDRKLPADKARVAEQAEFVVVDRGVAVQSPRSGRSARRRRPEARCPVPSPGRMSGLHRISRSFHHSSLGVGARTPLHLPRALLDLLRLTSSDSVACRSTSGGGAT